MQDKGIYAIFEPMFHIRKLDFLIAIYIFCIAASEWMGAKTFPLISIGSLNLNASVAIFIFPIIFTITDIVIEVHGKERAKGIIATGFIVIFLIMIFSIFAVSLPPSKRFALAESAYDDVFGKSIRFAAASLTAFAISAFLDAAIFVRVRNFFGKKALWFRNNASNFVSQLSDTIIFITLAFYALDKSFENNAAFLIGIILPYWLLKCAMSVIETPLVYLGVNWLKKDKE